MTNRTVLHGYGEALMFTDFDGVLNNYKWDRTFRRGTKLEHIEYQKKFDHFSYAMMHAAVSFDPDKVAMLRDFILDQDIRLVITSDRRDTLSDPSEFEDAFINIGITDFPKGAIVGKTPRSYSMEHISDMPRSKEIELWLCENQYDGDFIIIDDCPEEVIFENYHQPHIVRTSRSQGVTARDFEVASELLFNLKQKQQDVYFYENT